MITYETYCKIIHMHQQHLRVSQIALELGINERTVQKWIDAGSFHQRRNSHKKSKLDPYKDQIIRLIENYPYSCSQLLQKLRELGYQGGATILGDYLSKVRPRREKAFLTLHFEPGECAQVDWGQFGMVNVGST